MFWYYFIPSAFIFYIAAMLILIAVFNKLGMYDE
jgi:hypothetical protein